VADAFERSGQIDPSLWASLIAHCEGIDVLPAPDMPDQTPVEPNRLHDVLESARMLYSWVVVDAPVIPHRTSLLAVSESDEAFLVTTSELASLHLTRRAVNVLEQLGFPKDRFRVLINRTGKRDGIRVSDMEKVFNSTVYETFPNDYFSLHRVISLGQALSTGCELGKAVDRFADRLIESARIDQQRAAAALEAIPV
jgi:pilus assembly protein CpaE